MRIRRIVASEVVVPAREGSVNSPGVDKPLHPVPVDGRPAWTTPFDALPKVILQAQMDDGLVALGECLRGHRWDAVLEAASALVGGDVADRRTLPLPDGGERIGFECLLADGLAQSREVRVVDLLGGAVRETVPVEAWSGHRTPDDVGDLARRVTAMGHTHLKLKCDLDDDVGVVPRGGPGGAGPADQAGPERALVPPARGASAAGGARRDRERSLRRGPAPPPESA